MTDKAKSQVNISRGVIQEERTLRDDGNAQTRKVRCAISVEFQWTTQYYGGCSFNRCTLLGVDISEMDFTVTSFLRLIIKPVKASLRRLNETQSPMLAAKMDGKTLFALHPKLGKSVKTACEMWNSERNIVFCKLESFI